MVNLSISYAVTVSNNKYILLIKNLDSPPFNMCVSHFLLWKSTWILTLLTKFFARMDSTPVLALLGPLYSDHSHQNSMPRLVTWVDPLHFAGEVTSSSPKLGGKYSTINIGQIAIHLFILEMCKRSRPFDWWEQRSGLSLEWICQSNFLCKVYQSRCAWHFVRLVDHSKLGCQSSLRVTYSSQNWTDMAVTTACMDLKYARRQLFAGDSENALPLAHEKKPQFYGRNWPRFFTFGDFFFLVC